MKESREQMIARKRNNRASVVLAEIVKYDRWTSIEMILKVCAMGHETVGEALKDLVADDLAVVREVIVGKKAKTGEAIIGRYFATPEVAKRLAHVDIAAERTGRPKKEPTMIQPRAETYPKLTRAENQLAGAQMERLKLLASRMRAGEQMGTADLAECMLVGGWVSQITTAPMAAIDMACKLRDKARKMMRAER